MNPPTPVAAPSARGEVRMTFARHLSHRDRVHSHHVALPMGPRGGRWTERIGGREGQVFRRPDRIVAQSLQERGGRGGRLVRVTHFVQHS